MLILEEIRQRVFNSFKESNKTIELIQMFDDSFFPCSPYETPESYEEQLTEFVKERLDYLRRNKSGLKISFLFAWYDLWIGLYYDKKKRWLYIFPIPFFGLVIKFETNQRKICEHFWYEIFSSKAIGIISHCPRCNQIKKDDF